MATQAAELSFPKRLKMYLDERFPLATHLVVVFAFFFSNHFLAQRLLRETTTFDARAAAGMLTLLLSLFLLRVFDEFKDYERDVVGHPDRVVSRGIMPLSELKIIGFVIAGLMLGLNLLLGWETLLMYLGVVGYSWLMFKEFYLSEWLEKHKIIYAVTHQVITPLLCLYVYVLTSGLLQAQWTSAVGWVLLMGTGTGLGWEISRKVRMPEEEHPQIDTYSKFMGPFKAAALGLAILMVGAFGAVMACGDVKAPPYVHALLVVGELATFYGFISFWRAPTAKGARKLGDWAAIVMLLSYVAVALAAVAGRGVQFHL